LILVQEAVADEFLELVTKEAEKIIPGNGLDKATTLGPMVNKHQREHVIEQLREAVTAGAMVMAGGVCHGDPFIMPTVLANVPEEASVSREETFGPVICVTRVSSDDEAVEKANATPFGLGAVVFGTDLDRAGAVARRLTAGMIGVNRACGGAQGTPWVGAQESGYGFHKGKDGHRQFTQTRVVSVAI